MIKQFPDAQGLGHAPGLRIAAALGMRRVAVQNFGNLAEAAFVHQLFHAAEIRFCRRDRFRRKIPRARQRLAKMSGTSRSTPCRCDRPACGACPRRLRNAASTARPDCSKADRRCHRPAMARKPATARASATRPGTTRYFCAASTQRFARSPVTRPRLTAKRQLLRSASLGVASRAMTRGPASSTSANQPLSSSQNNFSNEAVARSARSRHFFCSDRR